MKVTRRTGSLVIVLVIFAAIVLGTALAAIAIDKSEIPMLQQHAAEAAVTADGYTHGSNVKNNTTATAVSSPSDLVSKIQSSTTIRLTSDITLTSDQVEQIWNTTYSGTLYGNGHTITVSFPSTGNAASVPTSTHKSAYGGLVGKLTGAIYDLKFVHTGGQLNVQMGGNNSGFAGGLVGSVEGGTIENVRVELSNSNGGRVGFAKSSSGSGGWGSTNYLVAAGALAGRIYSGTVKNVTVVNNAWIEAGVYSSNTSISTRAPGCVGNIAGIIGPVQDEPAGGSITIDNIVVEGNDETVTDATLYGDYVSNIGTPTASNLGITITNFYNKFKNNLNGNASSATFLNYSGVSGSLSVTNTYIAEGATGASGVTIPNNADYSIYFDPQATNTSESLVVVKSGVTGGANYTATITDKNNKSYSDHYAFNSAGDTVVFRNLPTAASNWSSGGNFTCKINITQDQIEVPTMDPLNKWEHGYVSADTPTSGTPIRSAEEFENLFRPSGSVTPDDSGTYYLTGDITIRGFTGKTFGGTLDGKGRTIYIAAVNTGMTGQYIGGLVGTLSGTIKNVRVVIAEDITVSTSYDGERAFGLVAGNIKGSGKIENVNVVLQNGVTVTTGGGNTSALGGVSGYMESGTITKTTVQMDGILNVQGTWSFVAGIVGRLKGSNTANTFNFSDIILKGSGKFAGSATSGESSNEPKYVAAIAITSGDFTNAPVNVNGFIYALTSKVTDNNPIEGSYSSYGYIARNNVSGGAINSSTAYINNQPYIYVAGNAAYNAINKLSTGNVYVPISATATISTNVADSTIPVTPYFPASSNGNLVLVAGDGTVTVPDLQYTNNAGTAFNSTADGNYKVVTVAKANVDTATVTLEEPVAVIVTVDPMNQWEHGYVASTTTSGTAIGSAEVFEKYFSPSGNGSLSNGTYYLTGDITIRGFTGKTFGGTLDGNGHTIYIAAVNTGMTGKPIGGLVGELTGKIKNVRVVIGNNVTVGTTATGGSGSYPMIGGIVGYLNGGTLENVQVVVPSGITFATQQFSSTPAFGGMVGEMNGATLTKVTAVIDGTLAPYGSYVWAAALVGKQAQNGTASTLTDVIVRGQGTFNATASNTGSAHEDPFLAAVTVFQESSNVKRATVNGVIIDFTPTLNDCDCYGIFTNNNYGGGNGADYSNIVDASNIYVINRTSDKNTSGNKAINESAVTSTIKNAVQGLPDIPVTPYFPISYNEDGTVNTDNLVLVAGNGSESVTTPLAYNNGTDSFVSEAVTVGSAEYQVVTVEKANVTTDPVSLEIAAVNDPKLTATDFTYNGQNGIDVTIGPLKYGSDVLELGTDYTITIAAVAGGTGFVGTTGKPVNAGEYTLTVTLTNHKFADDSSEKILYFTVSRKAVEVTVTADDREYDGTTNVTLSGGALSGVVSGDDVTANLGTGTAAQADVGTGISVTVKVELTGDQAANYVLQSQPTVTVNITPKVLSFTAGRTSFLFADTSGIAITDHNLIAGNTYLLDVDGDKAYTLKVSEALTYVTDNTDSRTNYLAVGEYTVTLSPLSGNYTFGSDNTFTFDVTKNESANTWITEYARDGWTYYSDPTAETTPVARFGSPAITYSNGNEGFSNTTAQGTYKVNVSVAETGNYGALTEEYSFTVSALEVALAVEADDTVYDGQPYEASNISITLTATVNGEETTYTSAKHPDNVSDLLGSYGWQYSVDGATKTTGLPTGDAGTYTIYIIDYDGNRNVKVSGTSADAAVIAKAEVTFSAAIKGGAELVYGTVPEDFNSLVDVTVTSGGIDLSAENWSFTVKPSVENGGKYEATTDAGKTVTLTVTIEVTDPNYTAVQPTKQPTLVIQKAVIGEISVTNFGTVTIGDTTCAGFVYGKVESLEFSGIPADLKVEPAYNYTKDGKAIDAFNSAAAAGNYTVTVSITGDDNYNDKTSEAIEFAIAQAEVTFRAEIEGGVELVYGTVPKDFKSLVNVTAKEGGVDLTDDNWDYTVTPSVEGGKYEATTDAGTTVTLTVQVTVTDPNHTAVQPAKLELTVQKKPVAVTANDVNEIYGSSFVPTDDANGYFGKYFTVDGAPITDLTKENSTVTITVSGFDQTADILNAGDYTVSVTVSGNHYIESVNDEQVSNNSAVINYNVAPKELSFTTAENLSFLFADTKGTAITDQNLDKGDTYSVKVTGFVEADPPEAKAYTLTVSKDSGTLTYVTDNTASHTNYLAVGTYRVTLSPLNGNYTFGSNNTFTFEVTKGENTWISEDKIDNYPFGFEGKPVTGKAKFGTAAVTYYREGKAIEFNFDARAQDAGTYTAVVSVPANDNNYDGISYEYTFVVQKHGLNITDLTIDGTGVEVSGSAEDGFTVTYAPDMGLSATVDVGYMEGYQGLLSDLLGDLNTRTYLFEYSADAAEPKVWTDGLPENAGTYTVRFKGMELAADYNINNFKYNQPEVGLTIDPAKITVTAGIPENAAVVYGMTKDEICKLITLTPKEGVTLGEVTVTYNNGTNNETPYDNTVAAGTELTISVSVNAENENYIAQFEGGASTTVLKATVQKATLNVSAKGSSVLSANFDPDEFNEFKMYDAITAKWNGKIVTASDYFDVTLTGYKGEVTGMTAEENFANKEIGTYTFTVTLKDDYAVNFVTDPETIVYKLTLGQSIVTLTVSIGNWTYGGTAAKPTFTVTASDGTPIDILTIGQYITINYSNDSGYDSPDQPTDAGTYTLTANIVGHHDYVAENVATAKFTISPAEVTFGATLAEGAKLVYGIFTDTAAAHDLVVVTAEGYQDLPFDYSVRLSVAGGIYSETTPALTQVTVSVEVVTGPNYTAVQPDELALTVQKADQSVTVSIDGWAYGDTAKDYKIVGIMENPDLTAVYSGTTNAGEKYDSETAPKKAGKYTLTVSWKETKNYTAGKAEPVAFTVEKAKLTKPTEIGNTYTYTGAEQTYTPYGFDADTMTISGNVQTNADTYTVTVSVTDKYNYVWADNPDTDITFTFVIGKAEQSVNVSIDGWAYGDQANEPDIDGIEESAATTAFYSGTTNAGVKYDSATAPTAAGNYTVTVSWAETTNYTAGKAEPVAFVIAKAEIAKPSAHDGTFVYTGAAQTYTPDGFDAATMTIAGNVQTNAGNYTVTVSVTDKYNYVWADDTDTDITFTFAIGKANQSVTVKIDGWTYGETAKEYSVEGIMENADYTVNYSGDGYSADTAPVNAGNYTLTITVDATANYNAAVASAEFTIAPKELHVSDSVMIIEVEYGELTLDDISSDKAILAVIGDYTAIFDGLVYDDVLTPDDFTLTAAEDYSDLVADGFMAVDDYSIKVALNATLTNYVVPESGLENITFRVVKAANSIGRYSVSGWTYLDVRSEYIPAFSAAVFGTVVGSFFDENGTEIAVDDFGATTPAGTYTFRLSVADSDNYSGATRTGSFVVDKRIVVAELTATDVTYDGAVYDGISYTLSFDVSDYIGTVGYEYSENGSAFRKGLPTDAGNYSVRIGEYSDSENIELRAETVSFQINPAPMHFTVTGVDGASVEYGTAIDDIDMNALIVSVIPDSYVGGFEFTVSLITANGTAYRPGLYAGTTLYATVDITLDSNNYYPVVDTAIEMLPKVNITKVSHDMAFEISDEIITDGSSAAVIEGSANTVIDAISYYMAINDIQYYEYHITVDGEEYSRDFVWAPGTHTVEVRLSGNHEGLTQFTVVIEENPDAVDRAPFIPKTVVGEVLESINFTWASAVSIAFGVAVAVLIILFFGLRRAKRK